VVANGGEVFRCALAVQVGSQEPQFNVVADCYPALCATLPCTEAQPGLHAIWALGLLSAGDVNLDASMLVLSAGEKKNPLSSGGQNRAQLP